MLHSLKRLAQDLPLKQKILSLLWFSLIPLSLAAMLGLSGVTQSHSEMLYRNIAAQLSYSAQTISGELQSIEMMSYMLYTHEDVQKALPVLRNPVDYVEWNAARRSLFTLLLEYHERFRDNHVSYVDLFCGDYMTSGNGSASRLTPDEVLEAARGAARQAEGAPVWFSAYSGEQGLFLCREIRRLKSAPYEALGEEIICIDISAMVRDATYFSGQYESADYLLLDGGDVIFHSSGLTDEQAVQIEKELERDYGVLRLDGHSRFAVRGGIPRSSWDYICIVSYEDIARQLVSVQIFYGAMLALCVLMIVWLASLVVAPLDRQFAALIDKMTAVGKNEWPEHRAEPDGTGRRDELGILHQRFDQMTEQLQSLIQANYVNELLKKEAQLKALENQINPHFLYNTLESINWRAKALGAEDISTMAQSLGSLLRATLSESGGLFTLRCELELVRSYMSIMMFRFEDRLTFHVDIPDELLDTLIPKLIIQPLVENAIRYGVEESTEACEIDIAGRREGETLYLTVSNSDSFFEENLLEKLRSRGAPSHGHGIALLNIEQRIRLTFGEEYGLTLYNQDERAVACIKLPVKGGAERAEGDDRG